MRERLLSLVALPLFFAVQMSPCLAQTAPPSLAHIHGATSLNGIPDHQWTGYQHSDSGSNGTTPIWHHFADGSLSHTASVSSSSNPQTGVTTHQFHHHYENQSGPQTWFGVNGAHYWPSVLPGSSHANTNSTNAGGAGWQAMNTPSQHTALAIQPGAHAVQSQPVNLDLSSTSARTTGGHLLGNRTVDITVGGTQLVVTPSTVLTPAEMAAVWQVLHTGQQTLVLDAQGGANGGSLTIGSRLSAHLSSLVIPSGVTVIDLSRTGALNVMGNLVDNGSLYLNTTNPALSNFSILGSNIFVGPHGLISTVLPFSNQLAGATSGNLGLSLTAQNNIVNSGNITTGGSLELISGGSITNALPQATAGNQPGLQALNNINISVGSGSLTNSGLIASTNGSINISAASSSTDLNITATGGTFQAVSGAINITNLSSTGAGNITINGGSWMSEQLNITASNTGAINVLANEITGGVNASGYSAAISNTVGNLTLSSLNLSGDPIFTSAGNLVLSNFTPGSQSDFIALAGGNITGSNVTINTDGGQIYISAGYQFTGANNDSCTTCINGGVVGAGGFTTNTGVITTPGASVNLGSGSVLQTSGAVASGQLTIQAPGSIAVGNITTAGAGGTNGGVVTGVPGVSAGAVKINAGGAITTGAIEAYGGGGQSGNLGNAAGSGGSGGLVQIASSSGAILIQGDVNTSGGGGGGGVDGASAGAGGSGQSITVSSHGTVTIAGPVLAAGGGGGGGGDNFYPGNPYGTFGGGGGSFGGGGGGADAAGAGGDGGGVFGPGSNGGAGVNGSAGTGGGGAGVIPTNGGTFGLGGGGAGPYSALPLNFRGGAGGGGGINGGAGGSIFVLGNAPGGSGGAIGSNGGLGANGQPGGSGGTGGAIVITGSTVRLNSTIGSYYGFGSSFDAQSSNAGSLTITTTGVGSSFVVGSSSGSSPGGSSGDLVALSVIINGVSAGSSVSSGTFATQTPTPATPATPAAPPTPSPTVTIRASSPTIQSSSNAFLSLFQFLNLSQQSQLLQQQQLAQQIGPRTATDYTPFTTAPLREAPFGVHPLQGGINVEQLASLPREALFSAGAFNAGELNALANQGIVYGPNSKPDFLDLLKGYVLFMPQSNISVQTREGVVDIPKGAVVWVMETGNDVAIYDFDDVYKPVKVTVNNKPFTLSPGTQLLLTRNATASFDSLNPGSHIAYRNVRAGDAGAGVKAYIAEFSITHGFTNVEVIRNLLLSKDPAQQKTAHRMLKNATILADLTGFNYNTER